MNMLNWNQLLQYFKDNSRAESVGAIVGDKQIRDAILAWPSVNIEIIVDKDFPIISEDSAENEKWQALWERVDPDLDQFSIISGLRSIEVESVYMRLKALHLIFPDGTVDKMAKTYLGLLVVAEIKRLKSESGND